MRRPVECEDSLSRCSGASSQFVYDNPSNPRLVGCRCVRACPHKSTSRVRFRADRTLNRHGAKAAFDPTQVERYGFCAVTRHASGRAGAGSDRTAGRDRGEHGQGIGGAVGVALLEIIAALAHGIGDVREAEHRNTRGVREGIERGGLHLDRERAFSSATSTAKGAPTAQPTIPATRSPSINVSSCV
jgi:hypothetical protein